MLLVLAFALIFYAASMNIGRVSQTKTYTQVAAMAGASQLASQMASYGQKIFQEQLGGEKRVCALTGIFMAIITIVIVLVLIVITIMFPPSGGLWAAFTAAIGTATGIGLSVALVLSIANLILQVAIIQPGLTAMWNKIVQDTMGIQDQFMEQGIQLGLQNVVTDNKEVPDMQDFDTDYVWGYDAAGKAKDTINRYAIYYNEKRLKDIYTPPLSQLAKFMNELRDLVYKTPKGPYRDPPVDRTPNWGLYDPPDCSTNPEHECCYDATADPDGDGIPGKPIPSHCNPCCIPEKTANPLADEDPSTDDAFVPARPTCCDCIATGCPPDQQCGTALTCTALSPYGADYPYVFTRFYENAENNVPRKRVQVVPDENPNIITIDGLTEMPTIANAVKNVFFESSFCPGAEPPGIYPTTGQIRNQYQGLIYSFGKSRCPKYFAPINQQMAPAPPNFAEYYAGYTVIEGNPDTCESLNPIKVSKVGYYDLEWGCDGIEPPPDAFVSFREFLGTDDENKLYRKDPEFDPVRGANGLQRRDIPIPPGEEKFRLEDTTGYYNASDYPGLPIADKKKGVFPFFYKMKDWAVDISKLDLTLIDYPEHCYWFDDGSLNGRAVSAPFKCDVDPSTPIIDQQPGGLRPQLALPLDPADPLLVYNKTAYVDPVNVGVAILRPDAIDVPSTNNPVRSAGIIGLDNECAQRISPLDPEPASKGFWKPGGDRFCQPPENPPLDPAGQNWPYWGHCAKSGWPTQCTLPASFTDTDGDEDIDEDDSDEVTFQECYCGHPDRPGNPADFPDDVLDDLVYGVTDFLDITRILFRRWESNRTRLAVNLKFWYPDIAEWIEPRDGAGSCFICDPDVQGQLWDARDAIKELKNRVEQWRDTSYADDNVWCIPSSVANVMGDEQASFGSGKVQDVVNCLTHNLSNATRFQACFDACSSAEKWANLPPYNWSDPVGEPGPSAEGYKQILNGQICNPLPRSLVPGFNGNNWLDSQPYRMQELLDCDPKMCIEKFRLCNEQRCWAENACEAQFTNSQWACENGNLECQQQCFTCANGCVSHDTIAPTPLPDYLDTDNSDFQACTNPPIVGKSCAQKYNDCTSVCDGNPSCTGVCHTNCINACFDPSYTNCSAACYNTYTDSASSCMTACAAVPLPDCLDTADARRELCYIKAKNNPLNGWNTCMINSTKCGGNSGTEYDCATEINVSINEGWTGNDQFDVYGNPLPPNSTCLWPPTPPAGLPAGFHPPGWPPPIPTNLTDLNPLPPIPAYNDDIKTQKGACLNDPLIPNEMIDLVEQSIPEAKNQVAKFETRRNFLASRLAEANEILAILREAEKEITEFLEGPARDFIEYRKQFEDLPSGLPYHAIYGWQGPPAESRQGANKGVGYWHVVKVEGRTPFKCDNKCGYDNEQPDIVKKDPGWPRVKTYTKNWGIERCYELVNTKGMVKFRVTRFDEDRDPNPNPTKFPGGQKLWDFRYFNPLRGRGNVGNLEGTCFEASLQDPLGLPAGKQDIYKGAFLMNRPENDPDCWAKANELLSKGASTELCAYYHYHKGKHKGMSHNFVKCRKDW